MEMQELVNWALALKPEDLPEVPFILHQAQTVVDREKFLRFIQRDLEKGPQGTRARLGTIQEDVKALWKIYYEDQSKNSKRN